MWENAASGLHLFILYDAMMHLTGYVMTNEIQIFHMETMDILNYNNIVQFYLNLHIWSGGYAGLGDRCSNDCFLFIVSNDTCIYQIMSSLVPGPGLG